MAIEIERRFLVSDVVAAMAAPGLVDCAQLRQGYFGHTGGFKLRVRVLSDAGGRRSAMLTRKSRRCGMCREEYEWPLDCDTAERALASLPPSQIVRKWRFHIRRNNGFVWSIDCFEGRNAGLTIAEVELARPGQYVELPGWVGAEITMNPRYGNSTLAGKPILDWQELDDRGSKLRSSPLLQPAVGLLD